MSEYSLEQMLSDDELPTEEPIEETEETQPTGEDEATEAAEETPAAEDVEAKDDSTPESDTSETPDTEEPWTKKAVLDERRKRQELQAELEKLKQQQQQPQEKPDWYDDPEKAAQAQSQQMADMVFATKVELSQDMLRSQFEDYDEMEARFFDMAQENPQLRQQLKAAANPARFAYDTAKKAERLAALENVDEYEAKVRAELEQKLEEKLRKEMEAKYAKQAEKDRAISPSLASAAARGGLSSSDYSGPPTLEEILNGKPKP